MVIGFKALSEDSGVVGEGEREAVAVADDEDMVGRKQNGKVWNRFGLSGSSVGRCQRK